MVITTAIFSLAGVITMQSIKDLVEAASKKASQRQEIKITLLYLLMLPKSFYKIIVFMFVTIMQNTEQTTIIIKKTFSLMLCPLKLG